MSVFGCVCLCLSVGDVFLSGFCFVCCCLSICLPCLPCLSACLLVWLLSEGIDNNVGKHRLGLQHISCLRPNEYCGAAVARAPQPPGRRAGPCACPAGPGAARQGARLQERHQGLPERPVVSSARNAHPSHSHLQRIPGGSTRVVLGGSARFGNCTLNHHHHNTHAHTHTHTHLFPF